MKTDLDKFFENMSEPKSLWEATFDGDINNFIENVIIKVYRDAGYELSDDLIAELKENLEKEGWDVYIGIAEKFRPLMENLAKLMDKTKSQKHKNILYDKMTEHRKKLGSMMTASFIVITKKWLENRKTYFPISNNQIYQIVESFFKGGKIEKQNAGKTIPYKITRDWTLNNEGKKTYIKEITLKYGGKWFKIDNGDMKFRFSETDFIEELFKELLSQAFDDRGYRVWLALFKLVDDSRSKNSNVTVIDIAEFNSKYLGYAKSNNIKLLEHTSNSLQMFCNAIIRIDFENDTPLELNLIIPEWKTFAVEPEVIRTDTGELITLPEIKSKRIKKMGFRIAEDLYKAVHTKQFYLSDQRILKVDHNKHPYARKIYSRLMQQFRCKAWDNERSWTFEALLRLIDLDYSRPEFNISYCYKELKKETEYLVENDFLGFFEIQDNADKNKKNLMFKKWIFKPTEADIKVLSQIGQNHRELISQEIKKKKNDKFSNVEIAEILKNSGLSLNKFAEEIHYNKGNLSSAINGKMNISNGLCGKIIKWLKKKEQDIKNSK